MTVTLEEFVIIDICKIIKFTTVMAKIFGRNAWKPKLKYALSV
jgi:hypothetical protein